MDEKPKIPKYNNEFNPYIFKIVFKKNLWLLLLYLFVTLFIVFASIRYTKPVYQAKAVIQLNIENRALEVISSSALNKDNIYTNVEILSSPEFIKRVIKQLPLNTSIYAKGKILDFELYRSAPFLFTYEIIDSLIINKLINIEIKNDNTIDIFYKINNNTYATQGTFYDTIILDHIKFVLIPKDEIKEGDYCIIIHDLPSLIKQYRYQLSTNILNPNAGSIELSFSDQNPLKCVDFLNTVIQEYKFFDVEQRTMSARSMLEYIDQQLESLEDIIKQQSGNDNIALSTNDTFTSFFSLKQEINKLELEIERINDEIVILNKSQEILNKDSLNTSRLIVYLSQTSYYNILSTFVNEYRSLLEQYLALSAIYSTNTYTLEQLKWKIHYSKNSLNDILETLIERSNFQLSSLKKQLQNYKSKLSNIEKKAGITTMEPLTDISQSSLKYYEQFLNKKLEYTLYVAGIVSDLVVLEEPTLLSNPIYPNKTKSLIIGLFIFILISTSTLIWKYIKYDNILSIQDIESLFPDTPILSLPLFNGDIPDSQLIIHKYKRSLLTESFRKIKSHLLLINQDNIPKVIVITSTIPGEGKTFIAINLGGILALSNKKVLIIDTDLRRPKMSFGFNNKSELGLSSYLQGECSIEQCICHTELSNLFYFPAGPLPEYPNELLTSNKMDKLIEELTQSYDIVILDTPPIGLISDATKFIMLADTTFYVFRSDFSKKEFLYNVKKLKQELNPKNLILVLNGFNEKYIRKAKYSNYGYEYKYDIYGYYDGYGVKETKQSKSMKKYLNYFSKKK